MHLEDPEWQTWSLETYPAIAAPNWTQTYGSNEEPASSLWCASLAHGFGQKYGEGLQILDYGCGGARMANFLARRLRSFRYIGVEPETGAPLGDNEHTNLHLCEAAFGHDPRVRFGAIGSDVEADALAHVDIIVAGSIFTHLPFREFREVSEKFRDALARGADFVFSVFIEAEYGHYGERGIYGVPTCWSYINYTQAMIDELAAELAVSIVETGTFRGGYFKHHILRMSDRPWPADDADGSSNRDVG